MVNVRDCGILSRIIERSLRIESVIKDLNSDDFNTNEDAQDLVCFNIFQIGELTKNLSEEFISQFNAVPWHKIKGLRNIIGHGYGTIEWDRLWETASKDIKTLRLYCEEILNNNS